MRKIVLIFAVLSTLAVSGCARQVGTVVGTAVRAIHHPISTAQSIGVYGYR